MRSLLWITLLAGTLAAAAEEAEYPTAPFGEAIYSTMSAERGRCVRRVRAGFGEDVELHCGFLPLKTSEFPAAWNRAFPEDRIGEGWTPRTAWIRVLGGWFRRYYEVDGAPVLVAYGGRQRGLVIAFIRRYPGCLDADADIPRAGQGGVGRPERIEEPWLEPIYPIAARERRVDGMVLARALIDVDGAIRDLCILDAYPPDYGFESAAVEAWRRDRFHPATLEGDPVQVQVLLVKTFRIE